MARLINLRTTATNQLVCNRFFSLAAVNAQKLKTANTETPNEARVDQEWMQAKSFNEIPGPSKYWMLYSLLPGGALYKVPASQMYKVTNKLFGDFFKIEGSFGKSNMVMCFDPKDFETMFRNEGIWPVREGLYSFEYYRKTKRPDVYKGIGGLISEQGEAWANIRKKVNPVLMKSEVVRKSLPGIDEVAKDFVKNLAKLRNPQTNALNTSLQTELEMWGLESVAYIALNARLGLLSDNPNPLGRRLADNVRIFFEKSAVYDHQLPHFWKYYETRGFKNLLQAYDNMTDICKELIDEAKQRIELEQNEEPKSVLEKLLRIDEHIALLSSIDMLMAGIDTTSSATVVNLYHLAKNPEKQERLRKEILSIMPNPDSPLTEENTRNMPYLRSCMKEALRFHPIAAGNTRTAMKDTVVSGYQIPKGTIVVMMGIGLSTSEKYFQDADKYMPERWLNSGPEACPAGKPKNPFAYLPFGFGPRTCIGKRVADLEIETLLARLIRNYKFSWVSDKELEFRIALLNLPVNDKFAIEPIIN